MNLSQFTVNIVAAVSPTVTVNAVLSQVAVVVNAGTEPVAHVSVALSQFTPNIVSTVSPTAVIAAAPPQFYMSSNTLIMTGSGGAYGSGAATIHNHNVHLAWTGSGGAYGSGKATLLYGGHYHFTSNGNGGEGAGTGLGGVQFKKNITGSGGAYGSGSAVPGTYSPAIEVTIAVVMPLPAPSLTCTPLILPTIALTLPSLVAALVGGVNTLQPVLPVLTPALTAMQGVSGSIAVRVPAPQADIIGLVGTIGTIQPVMPVVVPGITGITGYVGNMNGVLPKPVPSLTTFNGTGGALTITLPAIEAALAAGFGAFGTISARLPNIISAIQVLANALPQQLVMVLNLHSDALSMYTDYPYNSFCSMNGVYYGAGPNGFSQLDVGDADGMTSIAAGLGTGLLQFNEPHLKRISDAYMTLRTAGTLTFTITVDEGMPVVLTMNAQQFATFIQRRIITPKGLRGKSWKFEIANIDGADFDFGQLGLEVAVSTRRIGG